MTEKKGRVVPTAPEALCCGERAGEEWRGRPCPPVCKLCPASPTYWRLTDLGASEGRA